MALSLPGGSHAASPIARHRGADLPAATVLKPLCGAETETYECLRSFCDQEYPAFQVIFGVADPNDPVIGIAQRLQREFPQRDLQLVIDGRQHGSSRKVSNLVNMMAYADHDYIVVVGQRRPGCARLPCQSRDSAARA